MRIAQGKIHLIGQFHLFVFKSLPLSIVLLIAILLTVSDESQFINPRALGLLFCLLSILYLASCVCLGAVLSSDGSRQDRLRAPSTGKNSFLGRMSCPSAPSLFSLTTSPSATISITSIPSFHPFFFHLSERPSVRPVVQRMVSAGPTSTDACASSRMLSSYCYTFIWHTGMDEYFEIMNRQQIGQSCWAVVSMQFE